MHEHELITPTADALHPEVLATLALELEQLRASLLAGEAQFARQLSMLHETHGASGRNLVHYMTLRRHDVRELQQRLAQVGLSSLGRAEAHVQVTLDRMLALLALARGRTATLPAAAPPVGFRQGEQLLAANTAALLGPARSHRRVRIVVTMPDQAASDAQLVREMVAAGLDVARINCAHGDAVLWSAMIANVKGAARELGRACRILMDLGGPKLRTGKCHGPARQNRLRVGDRFVLAVSASRARSAAAAGLTAVTCNVPQVFRDVAPGHAIWIDDGKVGGSVESVREGTIIVRVTHARPKGVKLRAEKGINLPDTELDLPVLGPRDLADLDFVARHADVVGLSFVKCAADVEALRTALAERGAPELGIVLKIETRSAFAALPALLLAALLTRSCGVMIARGDLAVECGYERLAEVQEEILWVAEAAHVPTIWATQVLDNLARKGIPSRAEVTDAAMSGRAEAVMLNKGEHIVDAIRLLDDILGRMQAHQTKKRALLRPLHISAPGKGDSDGGSDRSSAPR